jgi:hypothetical protein
MRPLHRGTAALLALLLSLSPAAPARAADGLRLTLELLVVDRQNESGNDEIAIMFRAPVDPGKRYRMWPDDRSTMNVNARDCWYINFERACPNGYNNKSVGAQGSLPMIFRAGDVWTFEIWEDDVTSGDDLLLSETFTVGDQPRQDLVFRGTRSGADYTLYAQLSQGL